MHQTSFGLQRATSVSWEIWFCGCSQFHLRVHISSYVLIRVTKNAQWQGVVLKDWYIDRVNDCFSFFYGGGIFTCNKIDILICELWLSVYSHFNLRVHIFCSLWSEVKVAYYIICDMNVNKHSGRNTKRCETCKGILKLSLHKAHCVGVPLLPQSLVMSTEHASQSYA